MKNMTLTPQVRKNGKNGREHVSNMVRIPVELSNRLRQLSIENERTLNAEIVYRIALGLGEGADELMKAEEQTSSVVEQMAADMRAIRELLSQRLPDPRDALPMMTKHS